jgi:DNA helicase-2/ATP-dependent DNA helicase PcrA
MENTSIKIFAVGDPDQSIYGFIGADPKYLQELANDPKVKRIDLDVNYRCLQGIIDSSQVVLNSTENKSYKSARKELECEIEFVKCPNGLAEQSKRIAEKIIPTLNKEGINNDEIAVLYIDKWDQLVFQRH